MTGDDSYHAHCFKCRSCHNRIDELMFAKTSHGIYCMKCHHHRVARSRRHAQKQKDRERSGSASTPSSTQARPSKELPGSSRVCCFLGLTLSPPAANLYLSDCAYTSLYSRFCPFCTILIAVIRWLDDLASFVGSPHSYTTFRKQG
jgi:LIM domain